MRRLHNSCSVIRSSYRSFVSYFSNEDRTRNRVLVGVRNCSLRKSCIVLMGNRKPETNANCIFRCCQSGGVGASPVMKSKDIGITKYVGSEVRNWFWMKLTFPIGIPMIGIWQSNLSVLTLERYWPETVYGPKL